MDDSVLVSMIQSRWWLTCARCTLSSPLLIQVCMDVPPICEEHSINATTLTCRYLQVHGTSHPSLFGASGSICMVPGRKTDVQNWTGWNYSELVLSPNTHWIWCKILIFNRSFLNSQATFSHSHGDGRVTENQISFRPSNCPATNLRTYSKSLEFFRYEVPLWQRRLCLGENCIGAIGLQWKNLMPSLQGTWMYMACFMLHQKMWWTSSCIWSSDLQHLTKDMDHHVAKCHARPFLRGMSSLWFCFYDAKSWRILWQFG